MALIDESTTIKSAASGLVSDVLTDVKRYAWLYYVKHFDDVIYSFNEKRWVFNFSFDIKLCNIVAVWYIVFGPNIYYNPDGTPRTPPKLAA